MGKAYSFQANFEKFSQDTTRAKDSKDSKKLNSRLKSPLIICITDYCFFLKKGIPRGKVRRIEQICVC